MRESKKYLMLIPLKFGLALGMVSMFWFVFFSYLEYGSGMTSVIHNELPYFSVLMGIILSLNCLVEMVFNYLDKSSSEISLERYTIRRGGLALTSHAPVPILIDE